MASIRLKWQNLPLFLFFLYIYWLKEINLWLPYFFRVAKCRGRFEPSESGDVTRISIPLLFLIVSQRIENCLLKTITGINTTTIKPYEVEKDPVLLRLVQWPHGEFRLSLNIFFFFLIDAPHIGFKKEKEHH